MLQRTNLQRYPCVYLKNCLFDIYLNVHLLCYKVYEYLLHIAKLLSRVFVSITFPPAMYENSCAPRPHQHFILSDFSIIANVMAVKWNPLNIFIFNIPNN